jgi:hypothetical protein
MWTADWMQWSGPDGHSLCVMTPGGEWLIDGPARDDENRRAWTRIGTPPNITVKPSILMRTYHGFLTNGVLSDSL